MAEEIEQQSNLNQETESKIITFKNKLSNVKKTFLSWSKSADINCYTKMLDYSGNYFVQFIWLVILLGSTGATFYLIAYSFLCYLKYEVTTQTSLVNEIPTQYPTVTFCDNNPFTTLDAEGFMQNISILHNETNADVLFSLAKLKASSNKVNELERKSFWEMSIKKQCLFKLYDCSNDFHWYWSYEYGNCYQFNSGYNMTNHKINLVNKQMTFINVDVKIYSL